MKQIRFTIDKVGRFSADAEGFVGGACKQATKPILDKLTDPAKRDQVTETEKAELYATEDVHETQGF